MTSGSAVPPYEGRRPTAEDVEDEDTERGGAQVGGARRHRTSDPGSADSGGGTASPAEELPATEVDGSGQEDPGVGPAHVPGTRRGEDRPA